MVTQSQNPYLSTVAPPSLGNFPVCAGGLVTTNDSSDAPLPSPQSQREPAPTAPDESSTPLIPSSIEDPSAQPLSRVPRVPPLEPPVPHIEPQHCLRVTSAKPGVQTPPLEQQHCLLPDSLGAIVQHTSHSFANAASWQNYFISCRDQSDISTQFSHLHHPAAHLLNHMRRNGAPALTTTPAWSHWRIQQALRRGTTNQPTTMSNFARGIHGYDSKRSLDRPTSFQCHKTSPLASESSRRRTSTRASPTNYLRLQFLWRQCRTAALAPFESMQFGRTVHCLLQQISMANPRFGPVYMSKLNIVDDFYRIPLRVEDIPKLGVVFPKCPGEEQLVAFPLTLPSNIGMES
jgi:hypothetical protein